MFLIIHTLLGVLLGLSFNSLTLIAFFGILSHFVLDMIPHWDGNFNKSKFNIFGIADLDKNAYFLLIADTIVSSMIILFLFQYYGNWVVVFASIIAVSPDIANLGYLTRLKDNKYYIGFLKFHSKIQREVEMKRGLLIQGIFLVILIFLIISK
ncbi:MAG: hypothetical protein QXI33_02540 [Candidatus Pacearchaeota archaeon]